MHGYAKAYSRLMSFQTKKKPIVISEVVECHGAGMQRWMRTCPAELLTHQRTLRPTRPRHSMMMIILQRRTRCGKSQHASQALFPIFYHGRGLLHIGNQRWNDYQQAVINAEERERTSSMELKAAGSNGWMDAISTMLPIVIYPPPGTPFPLLLIIIAVTVVLHVISCSSTLKQLGD